MAGVKRTAALVAAWAMVGCGSNSLVTSPFMDAPAVEFFAGDQPQLRMSLGERQVMLTLLSDDMVQVAYHRQLDPGAPYLSPMVSGRQFSGPTSYHYDAARQRLTTAAVEVEVEGGCWRISDMRSGSPRQLTRLCVANWNDDGLTLALASDGYRDLYGLGQQLIAGRENPSWLGLRRTSGNRFGNAMPRSNIMASANTQIPVGYVLGEGLANYGFFVDSPYRLEFGFDGPHWTIESADDSLGLFLFTGKDLPALRHDYMALTGTPPLPPLKAFGLWISEYGYDNWRELENKLANLRQQGFPVDGAVLDLQWFGGIWSQAPNSPMGSLTWDLNRFPEPRAKLASLARDGVGVMVIEESYVAAAQDQFRSLAEQRLLAMNCAAPCTEPTLLTENPWWGLGGMLDWSNPQTAAVWHDRKRVALIDDGIIGHWTDLGEPELFDITSYYHGFDWYGERVDRHRDIHNLHNFQWSEGLAVNTARTHPQRRPWQLSRSGTAGSQRFGVAMWSGDVASSYKALSAHPAAQANMSLSGIDYYGSDVGGFHRGGFRSGPVLDKLYSRWFAGSALTELPLRPHVENLCNCTQSTPDLVGDLPSNLANLKLRYQLVPYLYSLAHLAYAKGDPYAPPLAYYFQQDLTARSLSSTRMLGPWLLTRELTDDQATAATYLPAGRWADFHRSARLLHSTGASYDEQVEIGSLVRAPLFMRDGAIVPMLRQAPAYLAKPDDQGIHWFDDLLVRTLPAAEPSEFVLYEDDGNSRRYQQGIMVETLIRAGQRAGGGYQLEVAPANHSGETGRRRLAFEVITGGTAVGQVAVNGQTLPAVAVGSDERGWYLLPGGVMVQLGRVDVDAEQRIVITP